MALSLRNITKSLRQYNLNLRTIMTTSAKLEKAVEQLQKNPYFEKYADRIAALQKTSPEEFLERLEKQSKNKEEEKKIKFGAVDTRYDTLKKP